MRNYFSNFIFVALSVIGIFAVIKIGLYSFIAHAGVSNLYATTCLGGWENTHLASGIPEAKTDDGTLVFTESNSARLSAGTLAQVYCGGFTGDILEKTIPKKILVNFSWGTEYPELINGGGGGVEAGSATSTEQVVEEDVIESSPETELTEPLEDITAEEEVLVEESLVIPESNEVVPIESLQEENPSMGITPPTEESVSEPVSEVLPEQPLSFLRFFSSVAYAEESDIEESNELLSTTTDILGNEIATTTQEEISTPEVPYGLVEVKYTLDGVKWKSLGFVGKDEFTGKQFEIPITEASAWEDISKIQVSVESVPVLDGVMPIIYLDSVWIETEYGFLEDELLIEEEILEEVIEEEIPEEDEIIEEVLEVNENPISNELNLKTRTFNDFVVDKDAKHYCSSEEFAINLKKGSSVKHNIQIFGATVEQEIEMIIGSLPRGIDVYFSENEDYGIYLPSDKEDVEVKLNMQDGAQIGNFTVPIIYTVKSDVGYSSAVCQINIVNL